MEYLRQKEDRPINLEESSSTELQRVVVTEAESSSTCTPELPTKPRARTERRELLRQEFGPEHTV